MTQTIAQQIKWNFKTNGELVIKDKNGNRIYLELSNGYWAKWEYDSNLVGPGWIPIKGGGGD